MLVYMWVASACVFLAFIVQVASCCCACCGGRKARKALKINPEGAGAETETGAEEVTEKSTSSKEGGLDGLKSRFGWKKRANADV